MDLSSVETFFRRTLLTGVAGLVFMTGMWCLKIVKAPKHPVRVQSTPVPLPDSIDASARDTDRQAQPADPHLTTFVSHGKNAQP